MPYRFKIDATVRRKPSLVERCLPVRSAIDFGGMWEVDGYYSKQCLARFGIKKVTMIDAEESENWRADPALREGLDFRKGDFSDERFMESIAQSYDLAIAYDLLLHQINLRHTLSLMLSKTKRFFLISNPRDSRHDHAVPQQADSALRQSLTKADSLPRAMDQGD